jgi:hypothetical protein
MTAEFTAKAEELKDYMRRRGARMTADLFD